jgi:hypothetical protein
VPEAIEFTGGTSLAPVIFDAINTSWANALCLVMSRKY